MATLMSIEEAHAWMLQERGIETRCKRCHGWGVRAYGSTATWRGGVGGQAITSAVCDWCWGSGDQDRKWPSRRAISVPEALSDFAREDAALSCGSSSCAHKKGGQVVNGPCRCYSHDHPLRRYVYAASRLRKAVEDAIKSMSASQQNQT